ncbi:YraN family protein [uncultured Propionivibrio sp.]|uniref:YraN family protein n=1 Tax=uncultured Propionivibrio sp. TaxID=426737 RepID=UPI0029BFC7F1|nr:YraN family protein [uncultured Propionivibrio sp.]
MRDDNDTTTARGKRAEDQAARFLEQRGLTVWRRNYRCPGGEIDLVCRDGRTLVFVEVRQRRNRRFGGAAASITATKQERIVRAAHHFLLAEKKTNSDCRIDCILIDGDETTWLRNAISAD